MKMGISMYTSFRIRISKPKTHVRKTTSQLVTLKNPPSKQGYKQARTNLPFMKKKSKLLWIIKSTEPYIATVIEVPEKTDFTRKLKNRKDEVTFYGELQDLKKIAKALLQEAEKILEPEDTQMLRRLIRERGE